MDSDLTVGEALSNFRRANSLHAAAASTWTCHLGPVTLQLPNFQWRRQAIGRHDIHHIITGYPCTIRGEFQMAAWEFAAGRFPHPAATLFCLPLIAAGVLWSPRSIWSAFLSGRQRRSLYETEVTDAFLKSPVRQLYANLPSTTEQKVRIVDIVAFSGLIVKASLLVFTPVAAATVIAFMI